MVFALQPPVDGDRLQRLVARREVLLGRNDRDRQPDRFHTRQAFVLDPVTGKSKAVTVGLVGIHIVQKTPSRPQWIWTTFEQVDNLPAKAGAKSTFHDGTNKAMPASNPYPMSRVLKAPIAALFNVQRIKPIHPSTQKTNAAYHVALTKNSVWRSSQLVMTQWPIQPSSPSTPGTPPNTFQGPPE